MEPDNLVDERIDILLATVRWMHAEVDKLIAERATLKDSDPKIAQIDAQLKYFLNRCRIEHQVSDDIIKELEGD